jgi:hypothetical protein
MQRGIVCIRDFNAICETGEKIWDGQGLNANSRRFHEFLFVAGMIDLGFKGPAFTWTNWLHTLTATHERLDRTVINAEWCNQHPNA